MKSLNWSLIALLLFTFVFVQCAKDDLEVQVETQANVVKPGVERSGTVSLANQVRALSTFQSFEAKLYTPAQGLEAELAALPNVESQIAYLDQFITISNDPTAINPTADQAVMMGFQGESDWHNHLNELNLIYSDLLDDPFFVEYTNLEKEGAIYDGLMSGAPGHQSGTTNLPDPKSYEECLLFAKYRAGAGSFRCFANGLFGSTFLEYLSCTMTVWVLYAAGRKACKDAFDIE